MGIDSDRFNKAMEPPESGYKGGGGHTGHDHPNVRTPDPSIPKRNGSAGIAPGATSPNPGIDLYTDLPQLERQDNVLALWLQGKTQRQISNRLGIGISTVISDMDVARSTLRDRYATSMQENTDKAVAMVERVIEDAWDRVQAYPLSADKYLNVVLRAIELTGKLQGTVKDAGRTLNISELVNIKMYGFDDKTPPPLELTGRVVTEVEDRD